MKIRTEHVRPPIGTTAFDWSAVTDNYEPGDPIGCGATEEAAIQDLLEQLQEADELDERDWREQAADDAGVALTGDI